MLSRMGRTPAKRWTIVGMVLTFVAIATATFGGLAGYTRGGLQTVSPAVVGFGVALTVLSIAATFAAQLAMGASWRLGLDRRDYTDLVTNGPYRFVRNPIYAAMFGACLGVVMILPGPLMVAAFGGLFATVELDVRLVEEQHLRSQHEGSYAKWSASVGRFVPMFGRTR